MSKADIWFCVGFVVLYITNIASVCSLCLYDGGVYAAINYILTVVSLTALTPMVVERNLAEDKE